mgnify:CR=1 FL=1
MGNLIIFLILIIYLLISFFFGFLTKRLSVKKGRNSKEGFLLGFLFSFLGIIIEYLLPSKNDFQLKKPLLVNSIVSFVLGFEVVVLLLVIQKYL